jgi:predicted RNA binding protein YcfA (HicA-like mRNA interferase family)
VDFRDVVKQAEIQGFVVSRTKKGHWQFVPPDSTQKIVTAGGTPSDRRAILNLIASLRRAGFLWRGR